MDNPYSAPQVAIQGDGATVALANGKRERLAQIGEAFVAWERLRLWYNLIIGSVALLLLLLTPARRLLLDPGSWDQIIVAAIGANACYTAAPFLEGYLTWWFGRVDWMRRIVFILGTMFSVVLTIIVVLAIDFLGAVPNQQ